jgi:hypothetical protein
VARFHVSIVTCGQRTRHYVASMVKWGVPLLLGFSSTSFLRVLFRRRAMGVTHRVRSRVFLRCPQLNRSCAKKVRLSQVRMLREVAGVRSTVSTAILFRELQVSPLDHVWWSQAVRFSGDVRRLPDDHVYSACILGFFRITAVM